MSRSVDGAPGWPSANVSSRMPSARCSLFLALAAAPALGCSKGAIPDPRGAAAAYASAAERGDADAIYAMLSERSRRSLRVEDVRRIVADQKGELAAQAKAIGEPSASVRATARVRYADGEDATLELEDGAFRITAADALPAGARSPEQALEQLRRVLARRSYAGLMRVLTPATRGAIESELRTLVEGLAHPEGLEVRADGDSAEVKVQGGHSVKLTREGGIWRVEDFE